MIRNPVAMLVVAGLLLSSASSTPQDRPASTVITNVTVLNGRGSALLVHATVVITSDLIVTATDQRVRTPVGAQVIDGEGGYLLPGFIDMHAHLMVPRCAPGPDGSVFDEPLSERMLSTLVDFGITTVRSPATPTVAGLRLRDRLNLGDIRGPRAMASAELINDPALTPEQLKQIVRDALPYKPDFFKVYARLPPASVAAVIEEAHAHRIPVIGHLGATSWLEGAQLGIDALTHAADWSAATLPRDRRDGYTEAVRARGALRARIDWLERLDLDAPPFRDMTAEIVRRGISIDPTLVAYDTKFAAPGGGRYARNRFVSIVPEMAADWAACTHLTDDWTDDDYRRWNTAYPTFRAMVRRLAHDGVNLTTGTDLTNPWVIPGESLHQEFELLAAAGFSASEILTMTGANAAAALKRLDIGVIEKGRRADLVLLRANPLIDIRNTRMIEWVMMDGRIVSHGPGR